MKQRMLIEAGGPNILKPGKGPDGAGFMPIHIQERPQILFGIPVAKIPRALVEHMLQPGAYVYADVDLEPDENDPDIMWVFGFFIDEEPGPVSITNLELVRPS